MQVKCNFKKEQWGILKKTLGILKLKAYHDLGTLPKKKKRENVGIFPAGGVEGGGGRGVSAKNP